jgi:hypothetical protein
VTTSNGASFISGSALGVLSIALASAAEHPVTARAAAASQTLATLVPDDFNELLEARRQDDS